MAVTAAAPEKVRPHLENGVINCLRRSRIARLRSCRSERGSCWSISIRISSARWLKADTHENVNPAFKQIYELLHRAFVDEKLVVPASVLHDIESSLATHLKDRIATYQGYLGQVRLRRPDEIWNRQVDAVLCRFSGRASADPLDPDVAFLDDPDQQVERFGVRVDANLERFNFRAARHNNAQRLEALRQRLLKEGIGFERQLKAEEKEQRERCLEFYFRHCQPLSDADRERLQAFAESLNLAGFRCHASRPGFTPRF
jgi:hypothetical protein